MGHKNRGGEDRKDTCIMSCWDKKENMGKLQSTTVVSLGTKVLCVSGERHVDDLRILLAALPPVKDLE